MIYRYFYADNGEIVGVAKFGGTLANPGHCMVARSEPYVDSETRLDPNLYQVDTTTHTLIPRDQ